MHADCRTLRYRNGDGSMCTRLVKFLQEVLLWLCVCGGCGFAEHPQFPVQIKDHDVVSIWSTRAFRLLKRLHCVTIVSYDQCIYHTNIKKPTTVLLVRLRAFRHDALKRGCAGRCAHSRAHEALVGRDSNREFLTARGKFYPRGMNEALAEAISGFVAQFGGTNFAPHPPTSDLLQFCTDVHADDDQVQRDFHG